MKFYFDGDTKKFDAVEFGPVWNGWERPVVTRDTLSVVLSHMNVREDEREWQVEFGSDGTATVWEFERDEEGRYPINETHIVPDSAGNYLLDLGLTLNGDPA